MEKVKTDIYKALRKNRTTTITWVSGAILVVIFSMLIVYKVQKEAKRYIYGTSDKTDLIPLELIDAKQEVENLGKGHILLWAQYFYNNDQYNYESQIEKSFWLIDDSGRELYRKYKNSGHYLNLVRTSSVQYLEDGVQVAFGNNGAFQIRAIVKIDKPNQDEGKRYLLEAQGRLVGETEINIESNFPKNPFGYMITGYRETIKRELN